MEAASKERITIMSYPAWNTMTAEQKCEFLHEWCENLNRILDQRGREISDFHARLQKVEAALGLGRDT
jgi:hypothetical protein